MTLKALVTNDFHQSQARLFCATYLIVEIDVIRISKVFLSILKCHLWNRTLIFISQKDFLAIVHPLGVLLLQVFINYFVQMSNIVADLFKFKQIFRKTTTTVFTRFFIACKKSMIQQTFQPTWGVGINSINIKKYIL